MNLAGNLIKGKMILIDCIRHEIDGILSLLNESVEEGDRLEIKNKIESKLQQVLTLSTEQHVLLNARLNIGTSKNPTYAEILRTGQPNGPTIAKKHSNKPPETMLIYPSNDSDDSAKTFNDLKKKVNVKDLNISVQQVKHIRRGGVAVSLNDKSSSKTLRKALHQLDGFIIKKPIRNNPYIKVLGVPADITNDIILEALASLFDEAGISTTENELNNSPKVIFHSNNGTKNTRNVVLQLLPVQWTAALEKSFLNVQWSRLKMINCVPVKRCYRCQSFGHMTSNCTSERDTCSYCSGHHSLAMCTSDLQHGKCSNCVKHNVEFKQNYDTNHPANSNVCPVFKALRLKVEKSIYYYHA